MNTCIMVDIETLGAGPRAVVLTLGAVLFNDEETWGDFYRRLNYETQLRRHRREVDAMSLAFWAAQPPEVYRGAVLGNRAPLIADLAAFSEYVSAAGPMTEVWAHSPSFDLVILESLMRDEGVTVPWSYRDARDVRTLRAEAGLPRDWRPADLPGPEHNALADCLTQVAAVQECWRRLRP